MGDLSQRPAGQEDGELETSYECLLRASGSGKIRRPPNAFMLFARDHRREVSEEHPCESNKSISTILGKKWKSSPDELKQKYHELARKIDICHKRMYPQYSYNPKIARIMKKERLRMKNERSGFSEELPKCFLRETAASSHSHLHDDNLRTDRKSSEMSSHQGPSGDCTECPSSSMVKIKTEKEQYSPPDLGHESYPLMRAMDDPPYHYFPSAAEHMQPPAASVERNHETSINHSNATQNPMASTHHFPESAHQPVPFIHSNGCRPGTMYQPFYYGRRFTLPMDQSHEELQFGSSRNNCSGAENSLLASRSHGHLYDVGQNGRLQECSCSVCERSSFHLGPSFYPPHVRDILGTYDPCTYKPGYFHSHGISAPHPFPYHSISSPAHYMYPSHPLLPPSESSVQNHTATNDSTMDQGTQHAGIVPNSGFHRLEMDISSRHYMPYHDMNSHQAFANHQRIYGDAENWETNVELKKRAGYQCCETNSHVHASEDEQPHSHDERDLSPNNSDVNNNQIIKTIDEQVPPRCEPEESEGTLTSIASSNSCSSDEMLHIDT